MADFANGVAIAAGAVIVLAVLTDLWQTVVLPRPSVRRVALARLLIRPWWYGWRFLSRVYKRVDRREGFLAAFGPLSVLGLFAVWAIALVLGYALILYGLRAEFHPVVLDFPDALYVSETTLVPLSYGDFVPEIGWSRFIIVTESAAGVALAALAITVLFLLYESFRSREEAVVALDALAGAPPSGVVMLEATAKPRLHDELKTTFDEWRKWSAMVLESHLAYPLLVYFRSSHDNEAWINSFAAVMDAAALVVSSLEHEASGSAHLMLIIGNHLVDDLTWVFRFKTVASPIIAEDEYRAAVERLRVAGYHVREADGWTKFSELRTKYASAVNQIANRLSTPPSPWVADRSYLPHRERARRPRRV